MAYGKYRHSQIKGEAGTTWEVEIWKKDFGIPSVGDEVGGGVVFHVSATDVYIIGKEDLGSALWGCEGTAISGAQGTAIGTGEQNTADIVAGCSTSNIAARMCSNLTLNGFSDWYLPSKDEAIKFDVNEAALEAAPGFQAFSGFYWTSTEYNVALAYYVNPGLTGNSAYPTQKNTSSVALNVRPVRSFAIGTSTEIDLAGEGFEIKWTGEGGTRDRQFLNSECIISLYAQNNSDEDFIYDIFSKGDKEYFIRIYKNSVSNANLWWFGWVQPSFDTLSNEPYPYQVNVIATDSIGVYKSRDEDALTSSNWNQPDRVNNHINDFGSTMSLFNNTSPNKSPAPQNHNWFKTSVDWWRDGDTYQSNDPFYLYYVTAGAYRNNIENKPFDYKKYDVFKGCMRTFNTVGFLSDGAYNFIQPNSLSGNVSGNIRMYPYIGSNNEVPSSGVGDVTTLLEIDQTQNANKGTILAGATITYEPLFKSVTLNFINGNTSFNVPEGVDLQSPFTAGQLQAADADTGYLGLRFRALHYETFSFTPNAGRSLVNWGIRTIGTLKIKHGTGSDSRWLKVFGLGFIWETTEQSIELQRGRSIYSIEPQNNGETFGMANSASLSNNNEDPNDNYPCNIEYDSSTSTYTARTRLMFQTITGVPIPQVSGDITIELNCTNQYWQYEDGANTEYLAAVPSSVTKVTVADQQMDMPSNNTEALSLDNEVGLTYTTSQSVNDAYETYELEDVVTGCTTAGATNFSNLIYSVKYASGSNYLVASQGFRRGNSGSFNNISQLLTKEFLELQTEPLEILQADIFSPDISPLKLLKYSINNDGSNKYYQFLGGTFKAQSETMSGEWFKIETGLTVTPENPTEIYTDSFRPVTDTLTKSVRFNSGLIGEDKSNNAYGSISVALPENTADTKVTLASASRGKIYNGQKLLLCYPDGRNPLTLTASGVSTTSDTQIDLTSFTPDKDYPIGSLLVPLTYDLTNVITGGGGGGGSMSSWTLQADSGTNQTISDGDEVKLIGTAPISTITQATDDVVISHDNSGASAGSYTNANLTVNATGHITSVSNGSVTPAGSNKQVQYNNSGAFGAEASFEYDASTNFLTADNIDGRHLGDNAGQRTSWNSSSSLLYYFINPSDFNLCSNRNVILYSKDKGGSTVADSYDSRDDDIMALVHLPVGYKIKDLIVYSNVNITFVLEYGEFNNDSITTIEAGGTTNSTLTLSSTSTIDERRYYIVRVVYTATSDEIWGGRITLEKV